MVISLIYFTGIPVIYFICLYLAKKGHIKNIEFNEIGSMIILWPFFGFLLFFFILILILDKTFVKMK